MEGKGENNFDWEQRKTNDLKKESESDKTLGD